MKTYPKKIVVDTPNSQYIENVFSYLEYIGYPAYVVEFEPRQVAMAIHKTIKLFHSQSFSHRICAISIFALTFEYQVIPTSKSAVKH